MDKNASCHCGSTKKYKHCCQKQDLRKEQESQQHSRMVSAWLREGIRALQSGHLPQALAQYHRVLDAQPDNLEAQHWVAVISFQRGEKEAALNRISSILDKSPHVARFHATQGNMLKDMGRYDEAEVAYQRSLALEPNAPDVLNNYGTALAVQLQHQQALAIYKRAITAAPKYSDAHSNLAVSLEVLGSVHEAKNEYEAALQANPHNPFALSGLSRLLYDEPDKAIVLQSQALQINPTIGLWWMHLARMHTSKGDVASAKAAINQGLRIDDFPELRIFDALLLPSIMGTVEEVKASRDELEFKLKELISKNIRYRENFTEFASNNFYLAYHGMNDRALQTQLASFYLQALPQLHYAAAHLKEPTQLGLKRRIGFISQYARGSHSVGASFAGVLNAIATDDRFDVILISGDSMTDAQMDEAYPAFARRRLVFPHRLQMAQDAIAALRLDVLVYLDIGMNAETYSLAFSRLARVQCVLGGHPVTTGVPTMDYFLSAEKIEVQEAQEHYSEKLIKLAHGAFYFKKPALPTFNKSRTELNLPAEGNLYLCPMTLFKIHPEFDQAVESILLADPSGMVLFVDMPSMPMYGKLLGNRFNRTIAPAVRDRVKFIPWITGKDDFMRVLHSVDVILDPFHFGIGTTAIWTMAVGTPYVTLPSQYMRGRVGMFYCKLLGIEAECVASSVDDYTAKAVQLATDRNWRNKVKSQILEKNHAFYENQQGIEDVRSFLATCELPTF